MCGLILYKLKWRIPISAACNTIFVIFAHTSFSFRYAWLLSFVFVSCWCRSNALAEEPSSWNFCTLITIRYLPISSQRLTKPNQQFGNFYTGMNIQCQQVYSSPCEYKWQNLLVPLRFKQVDVDYMNLTNHLN